MTTAGDDEKAMFRRQEGSLSAEVADRLAQEVALRHGPQGDTSLFIEARDAEGSLVCGMNGIVHWRWLYVRHFWVAPERRGQGLGRALMAEVERFADEKACVGVYLDTFEEGAAIFYERLGFARCGSIDNFPPGGKRVFLAKQI